MASRRGAPKHSADEMLPLLELSRAAGKKLLENPRLSANEHQGWELGLRNWLEKAFGEGAPEVFTVMSAGPGPKVRRASTPGLEAILTRERLETVRAQVSQLEAAMNILRSEASILSTPTTNSTGATRMPAPHDIFISQMERDEPLVKALIDLIEKALKLPSAKIRCTSIPGYKLTGGVDIHETLRAEIEACTVFLAVMTDASDESAYVASEIGARWMTRRPAKLLLGSGFAPKNVRGPLANTHMLKLSSETDLLQLVHELASEIGVQLEPTAAYLGHLRAVLAASPPSGSALSGSALSGSAPSASSPRWGATSSEDPLVQLPPDLEHAMGIIGWLTDTGTRTTTELVANNLRMKRVEAQHVLNTLEQAGFIAGSYTEGGYSLTIQGTAYVAAKRVQAASKPPGPR